MITKRLYSLWQLPFLAGTQRLGESDELRRRKQVVTAAELHCRKRSLGRQGTGRPQAKAAFIPCCYRFSEALKGLEVSVDDTLHGFLVLTVWNLGLQAGGLLSKDRWQFHLRVTFN